LISIEEDQQMTSLQSLYLHPTHERHLPEEIIFLKIQEKYGLICYMNPIIAEILCNFF